MDISNSSLVFLVFVAREIVKVPDREKIEMQIKEVKRNEKVDEDDTKDVY